MLIDELSADERGVAEAYADDPDRLHLYVDNEGELSRLNRWRHTHWLMDTFNRMIRAAAEYRDQVDAGHAHTTHHV